MISVGRSFVGSNDYLWLFPSLAVVLTVLGFVFAGDGLRDALDPGIAVSGSSRSAPSRRPGVSLCRGSPGDQHHR